MTIPVLYSRMTSQETKNYATLLWLLLISKWTESALGTLTLSPVMVAPVCRVGDPLELTCTASIEFICWSIYHVNEQGDLENIINDVPLNSIDVRQMPQPTTIDLATFTFMRTSAQGELPLITTLSIDSVSIGLNGTNISCIDGRKQEGNKLMPASTTIQVIDTSQSIQLVSELNILEAHYDAANVTVTMEWDLREPGIVYSVEVSPFVPTGTTRYQLTIPYNETFNLSITASTPCRPNNIAFKFITLNYAKCDHPKDLLSEEGNASVSTIEGYNGFPVQGSIVRFSCPCGMELIGPLAHSAKCTENGEWEPDPSGIMCHHSEIAEPRPCTDSTSALAAAMSSTFLVISILMFIGGFISGLYIDRKFYRDSASKETSHVTAERSRQVPVYDDILLDTANQQEQNLELKENVAYL